MKDAEYYNVKRDDYLVVKIERHKIKTKTRNRYK